MNNKKAIRLTCLLLAMAAGGSVSAQSEITILGGDVANAQASMSYSVGQVAVSTSMARAITVINVTQQFQEGVQQPFRQGDPSVGIEALQVNLSVYPNPTIDQVMMRVEGGSARLSYQLYDAMGHKLVGGIFDGDGQTIDMRSYAAGQYLLYVTDADGDKKKKNTYKIIKSR